MMSRNARIGLWLFGVYFAFYAGFVALNAFSPATMQLTPLPELNLATIYGFALIFVAFILSFFYGLICKPSGDQREEQK